ncbi:MAG: altronate dehydratase family protein [Planctomycetota bacterium]|nr:altronate dehydratase family protein [Planctomycetota bacterium]
MPPRVLRIHPSDDVILALQDLAPQERVNLDGQAYDLVEAIPAKHKFAAREFAPGQTLTMYGLTIGRARERIPRGARLRIENVVHESDACEAKPESRAWTPPPYAKLKGRTFQGYRRADGRVGTANHWIVVPLVFCENRNILTLRDALFDELGYSPAAPYREVARQLASKARTGASPEDLLAFDAGAPKAGDARARLFPHVDGVPFLTHGMGCGGTREDARTLCGLIAGYLTHPNVAGGTILSLGCQNAQVAWLKEELAARDPYFEKPLVILEQQQQPSENELMRRALRETFAGLARAERCRREAVGIEHLVLGVECGGSDGFSGISANPAIGHASDLLVGAGGGVILSEFPELCGVEGDLVRRCADDEVAARFLDLMRAYARRAAAVGSGFEANPSPGNIKDGLITDAMKSAGAAKKGGTSPVVDVLDYPAPLRRKGLNLQCTPGGDVESVTAMVGAGANVVAFSTGLGTPTGNAIAPVLKLSTNTILAQRLPDLIDLDAGPIVTGAKSISEVGEELFELVLRTASGEYQTKADRLGQADFQPWKRGVSL